MQNTECIFKIKEIYLEQNILNMKEYLKTEYFESVVGPLSKSTS